ncbi:MAG: type III pantothenate kinase [Bacteroidota bacterium]
MIVIDSGNTNCKIWCGGSKIVKKYSGQFEDFEVAILQKSRGEIAFSSVAPLKFKNIRGLLKEIGFENGVNIGEYVKREKVLGNVVQGIGSDRMLGMIGASTLFKTPLITADCGTATTVNFLKEENLCLGGAIFAGFKLQLDALEKGTEGVKRDRNEEFRSVIGKDTQEALMSGIIHSIAGGIEILFKSFLKEANIRKAELIITGGNGKSVVKILKETGVECSFEKELIRKGIEKTYTEMSDFLKEKYTESF